MRGRTLLDWPAVSISDEHAPWGGAGSPAAATEALIRETCLAGRWSEAATQAIRLYGDELLGFLNAMTRHEAEADDAFAIACEQLWRALPAFRWESSLRTLAYTVARHGLGRVKRDPHRRRAVPLSDAGISAAVAEVRTRTRTFERNTGLDKLAALRTQLDPDDQTLLVLRITRGLAWREIARILADGDEPTASELTRRAAALRKRFERLKAALRAQAR